MFKSKKDRELEKANAREEISIEEIIEQQRAKLGATGGTPVTEETLKKWKADKLQRKINEVEAKRKEEAKKTGGRGLSTYYWFYSIIYVFESHIWCQIADVLSGRALFSYDPTLFRDDDDADDDRYSVKSDENEDPAAVDCANA